METKDNIPNIGKLNGIKIKPIVKTKKFEKSIKKMKQFGNKINQIILNFSSNGYNSGTRPHQYTQSENYGTLDAGKGFRILYEKTKDSIELILFGTHSDIEQYLKNNL